MSEEKTGETVHQVAVDGFAAATTARYDAGRPSYSRESCELIADLLIGGDGRAPPPTRRHVLEVGAGTGKFTFSLLPVLEERASASATVHLLATDGVEGMVERLRKNATERGLIGAESCDRTVSLDVRFARADALTDVADASVSGGIVVAQAFHWFATRAVLEELARVLPRGASLVLVWNTRDDRVPWVRELEAFVDTLYSPTTPRQQSGEWQRIFDADALLEGEEKRLFGALAHRTFGHFQPTAQRGDVRVLVDRILSLSEVATFPPARQAEVEATVRALAEKHFGPAGERFDGIPYRCDVWWATRL